MRVAQLNKVLSARPNMRHAAPYALAGLNTLNRLLLELESVPCPRLPNHRDPPNCHPRDTFGGARSPLSRPKIPRTTSLRSKSIVEIMATTTAARTAPTSWRRGLALLV